MTRIFLSLLLCAAIVLPGCKAAPGSERPDSARQRTSISEGHERAALARAITELSKVEWLRLTNRPYTLTVGYEQNGDYTFTFLLADTPDQTVTAKVGISNVVLSGGWFPPQ